MRASEGSMGRAYGALKLPFEVYAWSDNETLREVYPFLPSNAIMFCFAYMLLVSLST